jgi:hypothetical protein
VPDLPGYAQLRGGGHWTRDVVFSADGKISSFAGGRMPDDPTPIPESSIGGCGSTPEGIRQGVRPRYSVTASAKLSTLLRVSYGAQRTSVTPGKQLFQIM